MKALLRLIPGLQGEDQVSAPDSAFDRVRADASAAPDNATTGEEKR
jgi:hypothetical protein